MCRRLLKDISLLSLSIFIVTLRGSVVSQSTPQCVHGCKCSDTSDAAVCCLVSTSPAQRFIDPNGRASQLTSLCALETDGNNLPHWPKNVSCLPSWRQLQIHLGPLAWPSVKPVVLTTNRGTSCSPTLERLVMTGARGVDDGLRILDPLFLRNMFFPAADGPVKLRRLTIQQTRLTKIKPGFIDQLGALGLTELEVRRNPDLDSTGLGVGWLAYAHNLRLLDLSWNNLNSLDLARWGFALDRPVELTTLILAGNRIAHLDSESFMRLPHLIKLDLSNNLLVSLPITVFHGLGKLKLLELQGNRLSQMGMQLSPGLTLRVVLPELRKLKLSNNTLLSGSPNPGSNWWLNRECPQHLTEVYLEHLNSIQLNPPDIHNALPPIAWNLCPALTQVILPQNRPLKCLPHQWLRLAADATLLPEKLRFRPSNLKLCPPSTPLPYPPPIRNDDPFSSDTISKQSPNNNPNPLQPLDSNKKLPPTTGGVSLGGADGSLGNNGLTHLISPRVVNHWIIIAVAIMFLIVVIISVACLTVYCTRRHDRRSALKYGKPEPLLPPHNMIPYNHPCGSVVGGSMHEVCPSMRGYYQRYPFSAPLANRGVNRMGCSSMEMSITSDPMSCSGAAAGGMFSHQNQSQKLKNMCLISPADSGLADTNPLSTYPSLCSELVSVSRQSSFKNRRRGAADEDENQSKRVTSIYIPRKGEYPHAMSLHSLRRIRGGGASCVEDVIDGDQVSLSHRSCIMPHVWNPKLMATASVATSTEDDLFDRLSLQSDQISNDGRVVSDQYATLKRTDSLVMNH